MCFLAQPLGLAGFVVQLVLLQITVGHSYGLVIELAVDNAELDGIQRIGSTTNELGADETCTVLKTGGT